MYKNSEYGTCSLYQFIYSFRKNSDSPFPDLSSKEAINALNTMKEITDALSIDYLSEESTTIKRLVDGNALFLNYWIYPSISDIYYKSVHPGHMKGVSGSISQYFNIGVSKYIDDDERKNATITVLKYITSINIQKELVKKKIIVSGITNLYKEEEVCQLYNCDLLRSINFLGRPLDKMNDYDYYSRKFRRNIYDFLYGNEAPSNVLQKIDDLTKIYYISLNTKDSYIGLLSFIVCIAFIVIMLSSLIFLFRENYDPFFKFLSGDGWIMIILGFIFIVGSCIVTLGKINSKKCEFSEILYFSGIYLIFIPVLYKLIINLPIYNNFSEWIENHKFLYKLFFYSVLIIMFSILYVNETYEIDIVFGGDEKIFQILNKQNVRQTYINNINKNFIDNNTNTEEVIKASTFKNDNYENDGDDNNENNISINNNNGQDSYSNHKSRFSKIVEFHYRTNSVSYETNEDCWK
ncbi:hypothetical protein PIROE2DRAFT_3912 [Piromyces sp. E2]|nr:hypothetical protein PIROE2DRAFT_3912 [Piromyces sp. E2]|eukprot:OUM68452.1 hypothetical protein PIROE2DRAFT_3912 [Piromyces sp. E2]